MVLQSVHEEALARGEKLLDTHQRNAQANFELASSLQSSLESVLKSDIVSISQKVENFDSALVSRHSTRPKILKFTDDCRHG